MSNKINVLGLGPGNPNYILPLTSETIKQSDVLIGGKRNLNSVNTVDKKIVEITGSLINVIDYIKENKDSEKISVIVSGDTGFYSLLKFLKKHFNNNELSVIPGISSMQYMFAKIKETWDDAFVGSVHGRELNIIEKVKKYKKVGLLTDKINTPQNIAKRLDEAGLSNVKIYVGENLSYENEKITSGSIQDIITKKEFDMSVVIIVNE